MREEKTNGFVRRTPFTMIDNELILCEYMSPTLKAVYSIACCYASNSGKCYPSYATLARQAGVSRSTVIRAIATLVQAGLLVKKTRKSRAEYQSNIYIIEGWSANVEAFFKRAKTSEVNVKTALPSVDLTPPPSVTVTPPSVTDTPKQESLNNNHLFNNNLSIKQHQGTDNVKNKIAVIKTAIKKQIDYDALLCNYGNQMIDEIVELISDVLGSNGRGVKVSGAIMDPQAVLSRFELIDAQHIEYILGCLDQNPRKIDNIKNYLLAALYNAPATMHSYYTAEANNDSGYKRKQN